VENSTNNAMQPTQLALASRCLAFTRQGTPCKSPIVRGCKRCRMHGAKAGAPKSNRNAWKHGARSANIKALKDKLRNILTIFENSGV
jgi:hypothetical protein